MDLLFICYPPESENWSITIDLALGHARLLHSSHRSHLELGSMILEKASKCT